MLNATGQGLCLSVENAVVLAWHLKQQGMTQEAFRRRWSYIAVLRTTSQFTYVDHVTIVKSCMLVTGSQLEDFKLTSKCQTPDLQGQ